MLVGRDVLEALCARHAELVFRVEPRDRVNARVGEEVCGLFLPMIEPDSRLQLSEDYAFCHRARAAGFRIWLAPWVHQPQRARHLRGVADRKSTRLNSSP